MKNENFIAKSKLLFGDKYDYSLVDYINNKTKVKLICKDAPGFGSEYLGKHKLKGSSMTPVQYKNLTTFSESMITKFKLFENGETLSIDGVFCDYKQHDARAFKCCIVD